jgi:hypothetical protein
MFNRFSVHTRTVCRTIVFPYAPQLVGMISAIDAFLLALVEWLVATDEAMPASIQLLANESTDLVSKSPDVDR